MDINTKLVLNCSVLSLAAACAAADVTFSNGSLNTYTQALSGRNGSVDGPNTNDPPSVALGTGLNVTSALATAGPIALNPLSQTFPGTTGQAVGRSFAVGQVVAPSTAGVAIDVWLVATDELLNMDGGGYLASASSEFAVTIHVDTPTAYTLSGRVDFDDQDGLGYAQMTELGGFVYFAPGPGGGAFGPRDILISGTLSAGDHVYRGSVAVSETPTPNTSTGSFSETSRQYLRLVVGNVTPPCRADIGQQGGLPGADGMLDNNDFVVFIDLFFQQNPIADFGSQGGLPPGDGLFDNNDFVVFIDAFFAGC